MTRTDENAIYWQLFVEWLADQPKETRVDWVQKCIAEKGPCPDELGDKVRKLLS